jgi:Phosphotransferase enzyme family
VKLGQAIARGTRSTVYLCGRNEVAKVPLPMTPDSWIRYEATYTAAVRAVGAPAPQVIDVVELDGRLVAIYERIVGPSMWESMLTTPVGAEAAGRQLAAIHQHIIGLPVPLTVPRQQDRLLGKIRQAAMIEPELIAASSLFSHNPHLARLCHGDLHPGNVIIGEQGPVVIDWFDACRGSVVADVARTSLLIGAGGATSASIPHLPGAAHDVLGALHGAYLEAMTNHLAIDPVEFDTWRRVEAAARVAEGLAPSELLTIWRSRSVSSASEGAGANY